MQVVFFLYASFDQGVLKPGHYAANSVGTKHHVDVFIVHI